MKLNRGALLLLIPAIAAFVVLLIAPLTYIVQESFLQHTPGRAGAPPGAPFTLVNYTEFLDSAYVLFFFDTFRIGLIGDPDWNPDRLPDRLYRRPPPPPTPCANCG